MKAAETRVDRFLASSETAFAIPVYQRNYDWTRIQCQQLFNDILTVGADEGVSGHFIGSIVYVHDDVYTVSGLRGECPIFCVRVSRSMLRERTARTMMKRIDEAVLDELLKGCERPEDLMADGGLMKELRKALMQRMLGAELTEHLGYEHGEAPPPVQTNRRNGVSRKTLRSEGGAFEIEVPRDREGSFEPRLIGKGQTRIDGLDEKIIAMYARGMSVRDIRGHLEELYGLEVSPDLISRATDAVLDEVKEWRSRALDAVCPVVILDALRVKIRDKDSRIVKNKAVYLALGITGDGEREVLGLWIAENEGAKFWLSVMTELRNRGVQDILIAVVDGLKGFPRRSPPPFRRPRSRPASSTWSATR